MFVHFADQIDLVLDAAAMAISLYTSGRQLDLAPEQTGHTRSYRTSFGRYGWLVRPSVDFSVRELAPQRILIITQTTTTES